jgi:4-cresol dehydrogenase (hydroxylating)
MPQDAPSSGTGPTGLEAAVAMWKIALGTEHVISGGPEIDAAETATFLTKQRIAAIIRPGSRVEVQECMRIAQAREAPVYPVSSGKNWGYGSRVPPRDGCVLMELKRLNKVLRYDEQLAYATVEAGVTFGQLHDFLRTHGSRLTAPMPGVGSGASVVGHALERGIGNGAYAERVDHACALEVVLPNGQCVHTGFARFPYSQVTDVERHGVGPELDGLLFQSNLGIVTAMTVWLAPLPRHLQLCCFAVDDAARLPPLVDAVQSLVMHGVTRTPVVIRTDLRLLAMRSQYPWEETGGVTPLPQAMRQRLRWREGLSVWNGEVTLPANSAEGARVDRTEVARTLASAVDVLAFAGPDGVDIGSCGPASDRVAIERRIRRRLAAARDVLSGSRIEAGAATAYWRKRASPPADLDPDRDGCGVIWSNFVVPFTGEHVARALTSMEQVVTDGGFEPLLTCHCLSPRAVHVVGALVYDREVAGADEQARSCHEEIGKRLVDQGYYPSRLDIQSMSHLPPASDDYDTVLAGLRAAIDPRNVLAPGRYISVPRRSESHFGE